MQNIDNDLQDTNLMLSMDGVYIADFEEYDGDMMHEKDNLTNIWYYIGVVGLIGICLLWKGLS